MGQDKSYQPGPASGAEVRKDGQTWTLVLIRDLKHAPEKVWGALTEPGQLREWAPFDANTNLGQAGALVTLTTPGAPVPPVETRILRADPHRVLEFDWGGNSIRWELEKTDAGTRLTLWSNIDRRFIAMGAAGWHICLDVADRYLAGTPIGRLVGPDALKFDGWQRLRAEYAQQFGIASGGES